MQNKHSGELFGTIPPPSLPSPFWLSLILFRGRQTTGGVVSSVPFSSSHGRSLGGYFYVLKEVLSFSEQEEQDPKKGACGTTRWSVKSSTLPRFLFITGARCFYPSLKRLCQWLLFETLVPPIDGFFFFLQLGVLNRLRPNKNKKPLPRHPFCAPPILNLTVAYLGIFYGAAANLSPPCDL